MTYTLDQIDDAIAESIGAGAWAAQQGPGFCRPILIDRAAAARWWGQMPENSSATVLREARADMVTKGFLDPRGGFPDDNEETGDKQPWE